MKYIKMFAFSIMLIIIFPVRVLVTLFYLGYIIFFGLPILVALNLSKPDWRTYTEIRCLRNSKSRHLAKFLLDWVEVDIVECRLRDKTKLEILKRLLGDTKIPTGHPIVEKDVIYFEFRYVHQGGGRQFSSFLLRLRHLFGLQHRPTMA